jgi:hypothetical protein
MAMGGSFYFAGINCKKFRGGKLFVFDGSSIEISRFEKGF